MKFVIAFNDKVTDKSHFNPRINAKSPPTLICASKSSKSKYQPPFTDASAATNGTSTLALTFRIPKISAVPSVPALATPAFAPSSVCIPILFSSQLAIYSPLAFASA